MYVLRNALAGLNGRNILVKVTEGFCENMFSLLVCPVSNFIQSAAPDSLASNHRRSSKRQEMW